MDSTLCKHCDVFVGFGGFGVVKTPDKPLEWLQTHCWVCGKSDEEVRNFNKVQEVTGEPRDV